MNKHNLCEINVFERRGFLVLNEVRLDNGTRLDGPIEISISRHGLRELYCLSKTERVEIDFDGIVWFYLESAKTRSDSSERIWNR